MFGITFDSWHEVCRMYFKLGTGTHKSYLQWFPFSKLSNEEKTEIEGETFFNRYIKDGSFVLFPEVMRHSENYIQKGDGSFRHSALISPIMFLVIQAIGMEISKRYCMRRTPDIAVFYAGNYNLSRPKYKQDYDDFYKAINAGKEQYQYFIKTDVTSFFDNINVNELTAQINSVCNTDYQSISQTQLLLIKELLLYIGNGQYPLIENSIASSYLATIVYLDEVDCELHDLIRTKVNAITDFQMIRYVDDLYILFSSDSSYEELTHTYNTVKNSYSSILKKHGLALNVKKCVFKNIGEINDELKKSLYDEYVNGIEKDLGQFFSGKLGGFLQDIYNHVRAYGITNEQYVDLIEKHFTVRDIEFTASEVYNYLVYENQAELKSPDISKLLIQIISTDITFLSIDPKRLSVMVMQSGNDNAVRAMLNQLFIRERAGVWNSYDTTIAIAYLIQSKFQHIDLLKVLREHNEDLYAYYYYGCRRSFIHQIKGERENRLLRCIESDGKAIFLYFMSLCEKNRSNYLSSYAYYKNFFDRISADMAFKSGRDGGCKRPNYKGYYREKAFCSLYQGIADSEEIIKKAHELRNANPLSHSSAGLIDDNSSSASLKDIHKKLDYLVDEYSKNNGL